MGADEDTQPRDEDDAWTERVGSVEYEDVAVPWLADLEDREGMIGRG